MHAHELLLLGIAALAVDIAVPSRGLAIEVDGPTHFCRNTPPSWSSGSSTSSASGGSGSSTSSASRGSGSSASTPPSGGSGSGASSGGGGAHARQASERALQPLGATLLKRRLLQQQGWVIVSIDTAHWECLRGAPQKRAFLEAAIAAAEGAA